MTLSSVGDIEFVGEIEAMASPSWSGQRPHLGTSCRIPREIIHALPIYSDALEREIRLERHLILERLAPALRAQISRRERITH